MGAGFLDRLKAPERAAGAAMDEGVSKTIRQTYALLSISLAVSALAGWAGAALHLGGAATACALVAFVLLIATMFMSESVWGLAAFAGFAVFEGLSLGPLLESVLDGPGGGLVLGQAGGATAAVFLALSAYCHATKKDFSFLGGFLFVGLVLAILGGLALAFFPNESASIALSAGTALLLSGYILYDTSRIVRGSEVNYLRAAASLYLDVLNLFLSLVRLFARRS